MTSVRHAAAQHNRIADWLLIPVIAIAAVLRLLWIGSKPGYDWDEPVYANIVSHVASGNGIVLKPQFGQSAQPYLFHPPFYFLAEGGWFRVVGSGITQARVWAALMSLVTLLLLFGWLRSSFGRNVALVTVGILSIDAWMVFTNRVSWIENTQLVFIVAGLWLYSRAMQRPSNVRFVVAGLVIGIAIVFKHIAAYVVLALLINWGIQRSRNRRQHVVLLLTVVAVLLGYVSVMLLIYNQHGHNYYWNDNLEQVRRTLGLHQSRGNITNANDVVGPLFRQYRVFVGTILMAGVAIALLLSRIVQAVRQRSWNAIRSYSLPFSWALAAVISFGAIALKFPHYFQLVLIPLTVFLVCDVRERLRVTDRKLLPKMVVLASVVMIVLSLAGFNWRIHDHTDNALKATEQYAKSNIPAGAVVLTEETIGSIIPQPYCSFYRTEACVTQVSYIITYQSATQQLDNSQTLRRLLSNSTKKVVFTGFKETITVYEVTKP